VVAEGLRQDLSEDDKAAAPANDNRTTPPAPCPICARPRVDKYAPFCSRRCADVDLYRWLKGSYVIPGRDNEGSAGDDEQG
jgi:endogenous inhibitor of DNA gyrase (YacG/DUF329 family)